MLKPVVIALLLWPALAFANDPGAKAKDAHEAKPEIKPEVKAEAKPEAKPESKPESKLESKPEAKTEPPGGASPGAGSAGNAARPADKGADVAPSGPVDKLAERLAKDAANAQKARRATLGKPAINKADAPIDPEPGPPPLKISALLDEARRRGVDDESDKAALVRMAAEISAARESLRSETARLETMLSRAEAITPGESEGGKKQPAPIDAVAKTLRGMKPAEAAPILSRMDHKLAVDLLRRIPPADVGKLMAALKPDLAAALATEIATSGSHAEAKK